MNSNYRKNLKDLATACKKYVDETKEQILWQVGQYDITTQDDNTSAYQKVVPTGATKAKIKSIGGMSYKSENLLNASNFNTSATSLHSLTNGILISSGIDSRAFTDYSACDFKLYLNAGTYQITFFDRQITQSEYQNLVIVKETNSILTSSNQIYTSTSGNFSFTITDAGNYGIVLKFIGNIKPMLVIGSTAPTEWEQGFEDIRDSAVTSVKSYGANLSGNSSESYELNQSGNLFLRGWVSPYSTRIFSASASTSATSIGTSFTLTETTLVRFQFGSDSGQNTYFEEQLNAGTYYISAKTNVSNSVVVFSEFMLNYGSTAISYKAYRGLIDTFTIPDEVKALEGYGYGINDTCYNYIDFENKKFVKKVGRVDLGTLNYQKLSPRIFTSGVASVIKNPTNSGIANILTHIYTTTSYNNVFNHSSDMIIGVRDNGDVAIYDTRYYDDFNATTFKNAMSGVYLYYELATPIETDISEYIDTTILDVEPSGTITMDNQYEQDVPSGITYRIEVAK